MSLVGSLEDLGLADILQIVSLSRKSGLLLLRTDRGQGRILLREGLVHGAAIKGEAESLRALLVDGGILDACDFDRVREGAEREEASLVDLLARDCGLASERVNALRRQHVEQSVMRMFAWHSGEFSFEICEAFDDEDPDLLLPAGLNTQYLAMEATRLGDERREAGADDSVEDQEFSFSGEAITALGEGVPGFEAAPDPQVAGIDTLALAAAQRSEDVSPESAEAEVSIQEQPAQETRVPVAVEAAGAALAAPSPVGRRARHLVAIDPDLSSLEWLKASVDGLFERVHIFQRREIALDRIRQYLVRGIVPMLIVADPSSDTDRRDGVEFLRRLRGLAPTLLIFGLRPEGMGNQPAQETDGVLFRPISPSADPDRWHIYAGLAQRLRADIERWRRIETRGAAPPPETPERLARLRDRMCEARAERDVLAVVIEFGSESFGRLAVFRLHDEEATGVAQHGLPPTGGPDERALEHIVLGFEQMPEIFERVLERRSPVRGSLGGERDRELARRLGAAAPAEAYAAAIESGGEVVALVYADNLPEEHPIPETTDFEMVLREAGQAFQRLSEPADAG